MLSNVLPALNPVIPFDDELTAFDQGKTILPIFNPFVQPGFDPIQTTRIETSFFARSAFPDLLWKKYRFHALKTSSRLAGGPAQRA